jgi:hypothetical protein
LRVKLQVNNLLNQQRITEVDEFLGGVPIDPDSTYLMGTGYQTPRSAILTVKLEF